jgi:hypothetical protein
MKRVSAESDGDRALRHGCAAGMGKIRIVEPVVAFYD